MIATLGHTFTCFVMFQMLQVLIRCRIWTTDTRGDRLDRTVLSVLIQHICTWPLNAKRARALRCVVVAPRPRILSSPVPLASLAASLNTPFM